MKAIFVTSYQASFWDTPNATSSPASESGATPCAAPAGPTIARSGPHPAHANLSARQAQKQGLLTSGTSGQHSSGLSSSASLQSSLESRLKTLATGSILYRLTWKHKATPSGRRFCLLRASAARISDPAVTGWPSPNTPSGGRSVSVDKMDATGRTTDGRKHTASLEHAVKFAGWPTVTATDAIKRGEIAPRPGMMGLSETAPLAGWPTARMEDGESSGARWSRGTFDTLTAVATHLAGWPTTSDANGSGTHGTGGLDLRTTALLAGPIRLCSDGTLLTGSSAEMAAGGRLDPAFSRWLMRLPPAWDACAPSETPLMLKRRRSSPAR